MAYTFRSSYQWAAASTSNTTSVNLGTDTLVIVGTSRQGTGTAPTVTVGGVTLTQQAFLSNAGFNGASAIFSGLISGSGNQNVVIDWPSSGFNDRGATVWTASGLNTTNAKNTGTIANAKTGTINIAAGDFLFAYALSVTSTENYNSSTETPAHSDNATPSGGSGNYFASGDWATASTNASWTVDGETGNVVAAYASWAPATATGIPNKIYQTNFAVKRAAHY